MAFWSGETLKERLPGLIDGFDEKKVDCASYRLALGGEAFVTSDLRLDDTPNKGLKIDLEMGQQCRIPPGQFAFLLTEERVVVPNDAIAFISMRARYKFRGLVNVSGFHVDPGWNGHLIFAVYNAGPTPIVLSRGTDLFLIWYASLDKESTSSKRITEPQKSLPDDLIEQMTGQVFSPLALAKDVSELKEDAVEIRQSISDGSTNLRLELVELRSEHNFYKKLVWALCAALITIFVRSWILGNGNDLSQPASGAATKQTESMDSRVRQERDERNKIKAGDSAAPGASATVVEQGRVASGGGQISPLPASKK
jgi:dCTP deaminase